MLFFIISSWLLMNTVMCCVSVFVSFEIYIPWNRKFYLVFTGSRKSCMVFIGFERSPFEYGLLIHVACTIFFLQTPTRSAQCFPFSNFNELSKNFKVSPGHDDFLIFLLDRLNHQIIHQQGLDWATKTWRSYIIW